MQAAIYGLSETELLAEERAFFRDAKPAGYILFRRNIVSREQLRSLTDSLRELEGHDEVPILIDQEGGRVSRMRPPEWPAFPSGEAFDQLYQLAPSSAIEAARVNARALGLMLHEVGVNVDCLPMLDVRQPGATDIVGDRALGSDPMQVAALGKAILDGLASAGALGVIKHIPGHGRALVDSHHELPIVEEAEDKLAIDLEPFERLRDAGARLMGRDRLGRDVFSRGAPEGLKLVRKSAWQATAFDLYAAYGRVKARTAPAMHVVAHRAVMTLEDAIQRVSALIGAALDWTTLEAFLPATADPQYRKSALASSFVAALELARQGRLELEQAETFGELLVRRAA